MTSSGQVRTTAALSSSAALSMVQQLFPRVWLSRVPSPLGRQSSLVHEPKESPDETQPQGQIRLDALKKEFTHASDSKVNESPQSAPQLPAKKMATPEAPVLKRLEPEKPVPLLEVPGPGQFHVAATMLDERVGVVVYLGESQRGLSGSDYLMVSKLVQASRLRKGVSGDMVDFAFFRWPPQQGLAQGLDTHSMGLSALKGFLHRMANKKQCSWLVFGAQFAQFCFQMPTLKAFDQVQKQQQQLLIAPSLQELHGDVTLKQRLWTQLKAVLSSSNQVSVSESE